MERYDETTYGEQIAGIYDELYAGLEAALIDLLQELAVGGRALELGIGTGRVALPLHRRGVDVAGIDASEAMLAKLRAKPGGSEIRVVRRSFAQFQLENRFDLVYVVFNTLFALPTQEEQVQCFHSVAAHLTERGVFVIEAFVPDLGRFDRGQSIGAVDVREDCVHLEVSRHDPVTQQVVGQRVMLSEEGTRLFPVKLRYAWPAELDLMARLAGLSLRHRWGSWAKEPFTARSEKHVSVYGRD